MRMSKI